MMDRISHLPDDLLLKILSFSPTKEVPITSVLSKRCRSLWMLVPKLEYCGSDYQNIIQSFSEFVSTSLLLHKAPVLESLHIILHGYCKKNDIQSCLHIASKRNLRELEIDFGVFPRMDLPRRMCRTLVVLHLRCVFLDVTLVPVSFTSLKTLHLVTVRYTGNEGSFKRFLSKCPVLEDLLIKFHDMSQTFTISVPSLQRLSIKHSGGRCFRMKTPSLKHLRIDSCFRMTLCYIQYMPHIVMAHVVVFSTNLWMLLGSLTSVKRISLCLIYPQGQVPHKPTKIFHQPLQLNLCTLYPDWPSYLKWMIEASPNLQSLKLYQQYEMIKRYVRPSDIDISIPECSLPNLETFEWLGYEGTPENRKLASYIFTNASNLKRAKISPELTYTDKKKDGILKSLMRKELSLLSTNSNTSCHMSFD